MDILTAVNAVIYTQFRVNIRQVELDRSYTDREPGGDLAIRVPIDQQSQHFYALARSGLLPRQVFAG